MIEPILQTLLLCQDVKEDLPDFPGTSLLGIFSLKRLTQGDPATHLNFWVYARIGNVEGPCAVDIAFADAENENVIARSSFSIPNVEDPRRPIEISQAISIPINGPGRYECRLSVNNNFLGHTTLFVVEGSKSP
jgi:hypothetical protein